MIPKREHGAVPLLFSPPFLRFTTPRFLWMTTDESMRTAGLPTYSLFGAPNSIPTTIFWPKQINWNFSCSILDIVGGNVSGENHEGGDLDPFVEGPWMTKHNSTYYLEYAAPGTQWNVYGDGVY